MDKTELIALVENNQAELIELCSSLLQIPSENPDGDTAAITTFISNYLSDNGIEPLHYEANPKLVNIVANIGEEEGPQLIYCGHSDTVPVGNREKWSFDPFLGASQGGFLLGRGASDMKTGLAGLLFTAVLLKRYQLPLKGGLTLAIVADEETGGEYGVPWLLARKLIAGDGCLIAEPSNALHPTIGQKGSCSFTLTVKGIPAHGSLAPLVGRSAIVDGMAAIEKIRQVTALKGVIPEELVGLLAQSNQYLHEENPQMAGIFEMVTCNIGTIKGGTGANVVADSCVIEIDCRVPFGIQRSEVMAFVASQLAQLGIDYTVTDLGFKSEANYTLPTDPVCRAVVDNIQVVSNQAAYGVLQWACSDARHFRQYGIPVLQYGPAELSTIHGFDERVKVENVIECAKVYLLAAMDFLNGDKEDCYD